MTDDQFEELMQVLGSIKKYTSDLSSINMNLETIADQVSDMKALLTKQEKMIDKIRDKMNDLKHED